MKTVSPIHLCNTPTILLLKGNSHAFLFSFLVPSGAPRKLNCVVKNSSAIEVSWKPPSQTQEGRIQGYTVFYTKVDDQGNSLQPPAMPRVKHTRTGNDLVRCQDEVLLSILVI